MDSETLSLLRPPGGGRKLQIISQESTKGSSEALYDNESKRIFPIRQGIPDFYEPDNTLDRKRDNFYEVVAPMYDFLHHIQSIRKGGERKLREEFLQELSIKAGDKVLEVSVGTGANLRYLPREAHYFGLDISWEMLKRCSKQVQRQGIGVQLVMGDAEALPFADNSFDVVFNSLGFRQINDKRKALGEMIRVAKPGAKIMIADQLKTGVPVELLPMGVNNVQTKVVEGWSMYCLSFYKGN